MMGLRDNALRAAVELTAQFSRKVTITSGRRTLAAQAAAMAENIVKDPKWWPYKASKAARLLHAWLDSHPNASQVQMQVGLETVMRTLTDEDLAKLSKHLSGDAFDVAPIAGEFGGAVAAFLRMLAAKYNGRFLEREGDLIRWHWQA